MAPLHSSLVTKQDFDKKKKKKRRKKKKKEWKEAVDM